MVSLYLNSFSDDISRVGVLKRDFNLKCSFDCCLSSITNKVTSRLSGFFLLCLRQPHFLPYSAK